MLLALRLLGILQPMKLRRTNTPVFLSCSVPSLNVCYEITLRVEAYTLWCTINDTLRPGQSKAGFSPRRGRRSNASGAQLQYVYPPTALRVRLSTRMLSLHCGQTTTKTCLPSWALLEGTARRL